MTLIEKPKLHVTSLALKYLQRMSNDVLGLFHLLYFLPSGGFDNLFCRDTF